jgi:O-antigen/teichoic acid export membrane protein
LINKIFNTFGAKLLTAIINLLIAITISQYLGASGKGEQGLIITTIALILIFSNFISGPSIVYLVPRFKLQRLIIPAYIWSLIVSAIFFLLMKNVNIINKEYILHVAILTTINSFASINQSVLIGKENIKASNYINLLQAAIIIGTLIICFYFFQENEIHSYIKALYYGFGASFVISFVCIAPFLKEKNNDGKSDSALDAIKGLSKFGMWNQIGTLAQMLSFRISFYFIEYFTGKKELGIYSNGVSIIESIWLISASITLVQYSMIVNSENDLYSQKLTIKLVRMSLLFAIIMLIPLIILPSGFYSFIFGREFGGINEVIWILAPGVLMFNIALVTGHYFSGTGKYYINAIAEIAGLIITIVCGLLLIPVYGIIGAGITASVSYIVTSIILAMTFSRKAKINLFELLPKWNDMKLYFNDIISYFKNTKST